MSTALSVLNGNGHSDAMVLEQVVIGGDLANLQPAERVSYYKSVCHSLGLNPLTKPFEYIKLNNKLQLYARKDCADQLRSIREVNIIALEKETITDLYVVTAKAELPNGRRDEEIGAVNIKGLTGESLANAMMKACTKAKRRVTLSICGLGWLDETEIESIPNAGPVAVNTETGEIIEHQAAYTHSEEPLTPNRYKKQQVGLLEGTEGFGCLLSDDKAAFAARVGQLIGREVVLKDLTGDDLKAAREELEARNAGRKRCFAILAERATESLTPEQRHTISSKLLGFEVKSWSDLNSADFTLLADRMESYTASTTSEEPVSEEEARLAREDAEGERLTGALEMDVPQDQTVAAMAR